MTIEDAIARSINHNEIVTCEFEGDYGDLRAWLNDNAANGNDAEINEENDGTLDVCDVDFGWRVRVTLIEDAAQ